MSGNAEARDSKLAMRAAFVELDAAFFLRDFAIPPVVDVRAFGAVFSILATRESCFAFLIVFLLTMVEL